MAGEQPGDAVRFGILGCARIAWKLARAMLKADGVVIQAVASRSLEKVEKFIESIRKLDATCHPTPYGTYEELLKDPKVDVVYIPLPTGLHLEWVTKTAEHGKHILLEKPVALSMKELDVMIASAEMAGVQIMDGTMWMHNPRAAAMKEALQDASSFGHLRRINSCFSFKASDEFLESNIRVQKGLDELGCLGDLGWYCIRASLWAKDFELPEKVVGAPGAIRSANGVFTSCGATAVWKDGTVATFDCGFDLPLRQNLQLCGSSAIIALDDFAVPHNEAQCPFVLEHGAALVDGGTRSSTEKKAVTLYLDKPQETLMLEAMAGIVRQVQSEGRAGLAQRWIDIMWKTQRVVLAVDESLNNDCRPMLL